MKSILNILSILLNPVIPDKPALADGRDPESSNETME